MTERLTADGELAGNKLHQVTLIAERIGENLPQRHGGTEIDDKGKRSRYRCIALERLSARTKYLPYRFVYVRGSTSGATRTNDR